jgi:hypothetical protein
METVEQVIIARLKEEIISLNKKIVEVQGEYYKNQRMMVSKHTKDSPTAESEKGAELQEISIELARRESELMEEELKREKEKSWKLQKEKEEYLAERELTKDDSDRQLNNAKTDISILNQEVLKHINAIRVKDHEIAEQLGEIQKLRERNKLSLVEIGQVKVEVMQ